MRIHLLIFSLIFFPLMSFGQITCGSGFRYLQKLYALENNSHRCYSDDYHKHLNSEHPERLEKLAKHKKAYAQHLSASQYLKTSNTSQIVYIPVVFHILHRTSAQNIPNERIYEQIERLNEDFSATNSDTTQIPDEFKPFKSDTKIRFILAPNDPDGNPTTGIYRYSTDVFTYNYNSDQIKKPAEGGIASWDTDQYLNIWVGNITQGILGYATQPVDAGTSKDGVVLSYKYVGNNTSTQYDMGRTATHEIGHYLGLDHLWGSGGCSSDDGITDTPNQEGPHYGVPTHPQSSCGSNDMFMNYMDYGNDEALVMFTEDQKAMMEYNLDVVRFQLGLPESVGFEPDSEPSIVIYPNPAADMIHIKDTSATPNGVIHLTDLTGRVYLKQKTSKTGLTYLPVSHLNTGIYYIQIQYSNSEHIIEKVIIQ